MKALRIGFLVLNSVQSSKRVSFISPFRAYFSEITLFLGYFMCDVYGEKYSTLTVSFVSLCIVGVRPCLGVLPWKRG